MTKISQNLKPFELIVYIGRFQPFHLGHYKTVLYALDHLTNQIIILVGSSFQARTIKNPWTFDERKSMILNSFSDEDQKKIIVLPIEDYFYNEKKWHDQIIQHISKIAPMAQSIGIIGHDKDSSSYYLHNFPMWQLINVDHYLKLNATQLRRNLFENPESIEWLPLPSGSSDFIESFIQQKIHFDYLIEEDFYFKNYKKKYNALDYPPVFVTADSLILQNNKILLIRRKFHPGQGLFALPGGFIEMNETIQQSALRELREETGLNLSDQQLQKYIKKHKFYDYPDRSLRGRNITHVYLIDLTEYSEKIYTQAGDDADRVEWVHLDEIAELKACFFDDHYQIIEDLLY